MPVVNLTPHPVRVYGWEAWRDGSDGGTYDPVAVYPPSGQVARIGEIELGPQGLSGVDGLSVEFVEYQHTSGLPEPVEGTWYLVSLALALALVGKRSDLLVPYKELRTPDGRIFGCAALALPV